MNRTLAPTILTTILLGSSALAQPTSHAPDRHHPHAHSTPVSISQNTLLPQPERLNSTADPLESRAALSPLPQLGPWVGIAKWISLGAATGFGTLGFLAHEDANTLFERLEARCNAQPDNCRARTPAGNYADPEFERLYQDVLDKDNQAQLALIASQVTFVASVAFFIADFQRDDEPSNIPYEPDESNDGGGLQLTATPGALTLRWHFK